MDNDLLVSSMITGFKNSFPNKQLSISVIKEGFGLSALCLLNMARSWASSNDLIKPKTLEDNIRIVHRYYQAASVLN